MEAEALDGNMTKAEILRGVVAERLTVAAQEIFAVVERTVAGYEEEAAALRQELSRQKRQLEVLLQPDIKVEVKLEATEPVCCPDDQFPVCEPAAAGGGGEAELIEEEEQHEYETGAEDSEDLGPTCTEVQLEEEDDEEDQEYHMEPDYEETSRLQDTFMTSTPARRSDRTSVGGPQDYIDLRIRCIEDSQINMLSVQVFQKYPMQEVRCPRGLQEPDFLDLLRSTFPQLAAHTPFDVFTSGKKRKLQPIPVKTLTPEELLKAIGHSALYIRLKPPEDTLLKEEDAAAPDSSSSDQTRRSTRGMPGRPRTSQTPTHRDLKIRLLEDSQIDVLSASAAAAQCTGVQRRRSSCFVPGSMKRYKEEVLDILMEHKPTEHDSGTLDSERAVFQKYPVQEVRCPRGLQEPDFRDLLRSTFPQLAAHTPFDVLTSSKKRKLQPISVKTLTPEELLKAAGHSALYIRLKPPEEVQVSEEEPLLWSDAASSDQTRLSTRLLSPTVQSERRKPGRPRTQTDVFLRIRFLEDSQIDVPAKVFQKYPVQEVRCPRDLQEQDFLDLLRSTFPQLAAHRAFDVLTSNKMKRLHHLRVKTLTPDEIDRTVRHSIIYIRLRAQEEVQSSEEDLQDSSSTSDQTRMNTSSTSQHDEDGVWPLLSDGDEASDGGDDWKPEKRTKHRRESKAKTNKRQLERSGVKMSQSSMKTPPNNTDSLVSCKVCRAVRGSLSILTKHAWSHADDVRRLCGVCGHRSESAEELRSHLQQHQKTLTCNICGKSFLSITGFKGHVARHKGKKPHKCNVCDKAFAQSWVLNRHKLRHKLRHAADDQHKCDDLERHRCNIRDESLSELDGLSQHVLSHLPDAVTETRCETCGRTFESEQELLVHVKVHAVDKPHVCSKCGKRFTWKSLLVTHMRVHTGEKPFKCSLCDMGFSQRSAVKRHMITHQRGSDPRRTDANARVLSDRINGTKRVR